MHDHEIEVFDKAKWHYESPEYPRDLSQEYAFTQGGYFLAWAIDHKMLEPEFAVDFVEEIAAFIARKITGPKLLKIAGGALASDMLCDRANRFAKEYFNEKAGQYYEDFFETLAIGLPSEYHVEDTWENYSKMASIIDARFKSWENEKESS